jgi:hypothetical protein
MPIPRLLRPIHLVPNGFPGPGGIGWRPSAQPEPGGYHQGWRILLAISKAPEGRRVGGSPRADRQAADELRPLIEEKPVRATPDDDHGPELRPRHCRPDPLDPNANGRALEPPEPTDERPTEARPHDSTPGVSTTDPRPQAMEADEPGISWRLADAFVHDGRIAPDARGANVDPEWNRCAGTGVQRPLHGPVHLGAGEAVGVEQPASAARPQLDGPREGRMQSRLGPPPGQPGQGDPADGDALRHFPAHLVTARPLRNPPIVATPATRSATSPARRW